MAKIQDVLKFRQNSAGIELYILPCVIPVALTGQATLTTQEMNRHKYTAIHCLIRQLHNFAEELDQ